MNEIFANEFGEIPSVLNQRIDLREAILKLIDEQPIAGKVTEGGERLSRFKTVLKKLVIGDIDFSEAYSKVCMELPRSESIHSDSNRVFAEGWAERLVRTQYSRFYNQAVMEQMISNGHEQCFIPHSSAEDKHSKCSQQLAGRSHDLKLLYERLLNSYAKGNWVNDLKIPDHPHCTHVVTASS